ncbi:hypothetical protein FRC09_004392 [Ceratobasidium sp. 395]|nr:hypothetical protein FRC09_004392 [Ceratobasidium sp. 395]
MAEHRNQETIYVELSPFEPSRGQGDLDLEDNTDGRAIVDLPNVNPFAPSSESRNPHRTYRSERREDSEEADGQDDIVLLSNHNPFSRRVDAPRHNSADEDEEGVVRLASVNPFSERESTRGPRRRNDNEEDGQGEDASRDDTRSEDVQVVLSDHNPFSKPSSTAEGRHAVVVELPSVDPFARSDDVRR